MVSPRAALMAVNDSVVPPGGVDRVSAEVV